MAKIAIIEDETAIAEMYRFKLEQAGYEVRCSPNGKSGFEMVETFRPDLILLDLMMPEMGGAEMLAKLRATEWGTSIKVIILTNISEGSEPTELHTLGIASYVVKANYTPAQVAEIATKVLKAERL
jgi:DNA-binding response OmpR family regulator